MLPQTYFNVAQQPECPVHRQREKDRKKQGEKATTANWLIFCFQWLFGSVKSFSTPNDAPSKAQSIPDILKCALCEGYKYCNVVLKECTVHFLPEVPIRNKWVKLFIQIRLCINKTSAQKNCIKVVWFFS